MSSLSVAHCSSSSINYTVQISCLIKLMVCSKPCSPFVASSTINFIVFSNKTTLVPSFLLLSKTLHCLMKPSKCNFVTLISSSVV